MRAPSTKGMKIIVYLMDYSSRLNEIARLDEGFTQPLEKNQHTPYIEQAKCTLLRDGHLASTAT